MIKDFKINESDLDKLVLTETEITTEGNKEKDYRVFMYTLNKNDVIISSYEVWIFGIGAEAVVTYVNCFYDEKDEEIKKQYVGKGYTTRGLIMLCNKIFEDNLAPFVRLDINPNNLASKSIAEKVGFSKADERKYELLNPKAEEMLNKLIKNYEFGSNKYKYHTSIRLEQQLEYVKMRKKQKIEEK